MPPKKRKATLNSDTEEESEMQFDSSEEEDSSGLSSDFTEEDGADDDLDIENILPKDREQSSNRHKPEKLEKESDKIPDDDIILIEKNPEKVGGATNDNTNAKKKMAILVDDGGQDEEMTLMSSSKSSRTSNGNKVKATKKQKTSKEVVSSKSSISGKRATLKEEKSKVTPAKKNKASVSSTSVSASTTKAIAGTKDTKTKAVPVSIKSEKDAEVVVLDYMKRANRPYSITNIFDNLHKAIPKAILQRVLDKLCLKGAQGQNDENQNLSNTSSMSKNTFNPGLRYKDYGKSRIYFIQQEEHDQLALEKEMDILQEETESYTKLNSQLQTSLKALQDESKFLSTALSDAELKVELTRVTTATANIEAKLSTFRSSKISVDAKKKEKTEINYKKFRKYFLERKRSCMGAIEQIADGMEKKVKDVISLMGVETDEEAGFTLPPAI